MLDSQSCQTILAHLLKAYSPLAVAFSGGLDSRFLAFMAKKLQSKGVLAQLFLFRGPHIAQWETQSAVDWAEKQDLPLVILDLNPLEKPEVRYNKPDRCYHCKRLLFQALQQAVANHPPFQGLLPTMCDGSNTSDREGYRPGQQALRELSVHSPLAEAGIGKEDIRRLGAELGLDNPGQRARPCLLTRYAYGLRADIASLTALGRAEERIHELLRRATEANRLPALPDFRLRLLAGPGEGEKLGDFELELHIGGPLPPEDIRAALQLAVTEQGFAPPLLKTPDSISGYYDAVSEKKQ